MRRLQSCSESAQTFFSSRGSPAALSSSVGRYGEDATPLEASSRPSRRLIESGQFTPELCGAARRGDEIRRQLASCSTI